MTETVVRGSARRWRQLSTLLGNVERAVAACARLDAHHQYAPSVGKHHEHLLSFNARVSALERRIDQELDRLTVERLQTDLRERQRRA